MGGGGDFLRVMASLFLDKWLLPLFKIFSHQKSFSGFAERAMASATESEMDWIGHLLKDEFEFLRSRWYYKQIKSKWNSKPLFKTPKISGAAWENAGFWFVSKWQLLPLPFPGSLVIWNHTHFTRILCAVDHLGGFWSFRRLFSNLDPFAGQCHQQVVDIVDIGVASCTAAQGVKLHERVGRGEGWFVKDCVFHIKESCKRWRSCRRVEPLTVTTSSLLSDTPPATRQQL